MLTFYFAPKTVSLASHITLEEANADYTTKVIDFSTAEQKSEEYLSVNPKARVPALVCDDGIITETPAILAFIAQSFPEKNLAPLDNAYEFAKCQEFNLYLCSTVHVAHAHRVRGSRWVDDEKSILAMQKKVPENMAECFTLIEAELFRGPFLLGDSFSICDAYLFTIIQWLKGDGVSISEFPKLEAFNNLMRQRNSVQLLQSIYNY